MKKLLSVAAGAVMVSAVAASSSFATYDFGQLGSGDIYRVKNVSDNSSFVQSVSADPCETVQFKVRVHNAGPKTLNNVKVKATLPAGVATSHTSTATVTADNNRENAVATGSASVNLSKASNLKYQGGTAELLDDNGNRISSVDATALFGNGVNIGNVAVSLNQMRFVQFKANVDCEKTPETPVTPESPKTPATPAELPRTGVDGGVVAIVASLLTAGAAYVVAARRNVLG